MYFLMVRKALEGRREEKVAWTVLRHEVVFVTQGLLSTRPGQRKAGGWKELCGCSWKGTAAHRASPDRLSPPV